MKLTVSTELGEFGFNLSQASVIYLLGLIQKIEDEGDSVLQGTREQKTKTSSDTIEEVPLPEDEDNSGEEDFQTLLTEEEEKRNAELETQFESDYSNKGKYKGFLYIKCECCGDTRGLCVKYETDEYKCNKCGGKTKLRGLRRMFLDCECGKHFKYYTNETAEVITANCIECGSPIDMMLNARRTTYISIGDGTQKRVNGNKRIVAGKHRW